MGSAPSRPKGAGLLARLDFRRLLVATGVSQLGTQVSELALPLTAITVLHASPLTVGVLAACGYLPIAVLGAEEATPVFGRVNPLRRLTRLPRLPVVSPVPLPAKFRIRFLEPVTTD